MRPALVLLAAGVFAAAAAASGAPSGTYSATIAGKPAALNGRWQVDFGTSRALRIVRNGKVVVVATASTLAGGRLRIHDRSGPYACSPTEGDGVYRYALAGRRLTFTAVSDRCVGRKLVLTTKPFLK
jgi:hypothetical protein